MKTIYFIACLSVSAIVFAAGASSIDGFFSKEYLSKAYDQAAKEYVHEKRDQYYPMEEFKTLAKEIPQNSLILDAGCGSGIPTVDFFSNLGHRVIGVDLSPEMIKLAHKHAPKAHQLLVGNILDLNFADNSFDLITSIYAIIHIDRTHHEEIFRNFYRMLKKGGIAYFTLCNGTRTDGKPEFHGTMDFNGVQLPYSHYAKEKYRIFLEKAGFRVISMEDIPLGGYTFTWVKVQKPEMC